VNLINEFKDLWKNQTSVNIVKQKQVMGNFTLSIYLFIFFTNGRNIALKKSTNKQAKGWTMKRNGHKRGEI